MNLSRTEQRVLHVLALGGQICHERDGGAKMQAVTRYTRDGLVLSDCTLAVFRRLRRRGLIQSSGGRLLARPAVSRPVGARFVADNRFLAGRAGNILGRRRVKLAGVSALPDPWVKAEKL